MKPAIKARALAAISRDLGLVPTSSAGTEANDARAALAEIAPLLRQIDVDQLVSVLSTVAAAWPDLEAAAIAWIDLLAVLVQNTEQRYRSGGHGQAKKAEVKAVLADLIRSSHTEVPDVPRVLQPVAIDVIAGHAVDLIVAFLNRFPDPRWQEAPSRRPSVSELWRGAWLAVRRALGAVFDPLGALIARVYFWLRPQTRLFPAVRSALKAVESDSLMAKEQNLMQRVGQLGTELASNQQSAVAAIQLVGVVVRVVEDLVAAPGPQKKAIAEEMVATVLTQLGFDPGPVASVKIDSAVGFLIDSTVHLFNARGQFAHAGGATTAGRPIRAGAIGSPRAPRTALPPRQDRRANQAPPRR